MMRPPCEQCTKYDKENKICASEPLGNPNSIFCKEFVQVPKKKKPGKGANSVESDSVEIKQEPSNLEKADDRTMLKIITILFSIGILWLVHPVLAGIAALLIGGWACEFPGPSNKPLALRIFGFLLVFAVLACAIPYDDVLDKAEERVQVSNTDPFTISAPVTDREFSQAFAALVLADGMINEYGYETGFVLMTKKSGHGYKTHVWVESNGKICVMDPLDESRSVQFKKDHDREYSDYHIKYVAWAEGEAWCNQIRDA